MLLTIYMIEVRLGVFEVDFASAAEEDGGLGYEFVGGFPFRQSRIKLLNLLLKLIIVVLIIQLSTYFSLIKFIFPFLKHLIPVVIWF